MTRRQLRQLRQSLEFTTTDIAGIADSLYRHKLTVYQNTLDDFAKRHGRGELPGVSSGVRRALRAEADEAAEVIAGTYNDDLAKFLNDHIADDPRKLLEKVDVWARNHARGRREKIAVTETYTPHADALVGIFVANGIDVEFDFGGHGDDAPACALCQAIFERNPHPASRVLKIGNPHIQCRQEWHPRLERVELPAFMTLEPADVAGIVGQVSLLQRKRSMKKAVAYVRRIK